MSALFSQATHPLLFVAVSSALTLSGHEILSPTISGGPLSMHMRDSIERYLQTRIVMASLDVREEVIRWFTGSPRSVIPAFSDAMECRNGQDPSTDLPLLLYSAINGDL